MKKFIIITIIVLCTSTIMAGNMSTPAPMKPGVSEIKSGEMSTKMTDSGLIGELNVIDGYRVQNMPESVVDRETSDQIDFPQMGRFH
jgi:hypothetical protein